tara:strand:- start:2445 stop:3017 length:573 start_codon:yes stop_codon:yes gene_type:complete
MNDYLTFNEFLEFNKIVESVTYENGSMFVTFKEELFEDVSALDLYRGVDSKTKTRQKPIKYDLEAVSDDGVATFKTTSGTKRDGNFHYTQKIRFKGWDENMADKGSLLDKVKLILHDGVDVTCDCPAFQYYGSAYITTQLDAKFGEDENRAPVIRNPDEKGTVCKHLSRILKDFAILPPKIVKQIKKNKK